MRCKQTADRKGLCKSHAFWMENNITPGPYYEEKIVKGLLQPASDYLSEYEMDQNLNGRYRGDGRRGDIYVLPDPMGFEP